MQEINELKSLVVQGLEANGVLSQLRAQIRSSVFKIIDQQDPNQPSSFHWENSACQKLHDTPQGIQALEIVYEFLQFYKMEYTLSVFKNEGNLKDVKRDDLAKRVGLRQADSSKPILMQIMGGVDKGSSQTPQNFDSDKKRVEAQKKEEQAKKEEIAKKEALLKKDELAKKEAQQKKEQQVLKEKQEFERKQKEQAQREEQQKQEKEKQKREQKEREEKARKEEEERQKQEMMKQEEYDEQYQQSGDNQQAMQSQGFDMSVDSTALEEYDYYEDVEPVR